MKLKLDIHIGNGVMFGTGMSLSKTEILNAFSSLNQWDLVCDRQALMVTSQSVMMLGRFVGSIVCGYFSDR